MPAQNTKNSREADKFVVRLPDGLRQRIAAVSKNHKRSMNDTMVIGAELVAGVGERQEILLAALQRELHAQEQLTEEATQMAREAKRVEVELRNAWECLKSERTAENTRRLVHVVGKILGSIAE